MAGYSSAQPFLLQKKVNLRIKEQSIQSAIEMLSKETGVRFSYDPDMFSSRQKITLQITAKPLSDVLTLLFNNTAVQFKEVGNQIVIFRRTEPSLSVSQTEPDKSTKKENSTKSDIIKPIAPDTVYVSRTDTLMIVKTDTLTVYKTETIIQYDTVLRVDTVYLYKTQKPGKSAFPNFEKNSLKNRKFHEQNGFYTGISYEYLMGSPQFSSTDEFKVLLDHMSTANTSSPANYTLQVMAGYDYYRIGLQSGIGFTRLGENFEYTFTEQTGGYYKTDTVEKYYTIGGTDTSWYYITDSSYVGIDYKNYSFKNPNAYRYLEIPVMLKFRIIRNEIFNVYVTGGLTAGFLIGQKALIVSPMDHVTANWTAKSELRPFVWSWKAGMGADYCFARAWSVFAEINYRNHLGSVYQDYPLEKKFGLFNLKTGIFVRL